MDIVERMLRHDAWTTRMLLVRAQELSDDQLDREFDIGHRSLRRTFAHIVGNMECWCDLMAGKPQRPKPAQPASGPTIASLLARLEVVAAELVELGMVVVEEAKEDDDFVDYLDVPARRKPLGAGLLHVATHGMHHRAQCLYLMRLLGLQNLIEGDALSWEMHHRGIDEWPQATPPTPEVTWMVYRIDDNGNRFVVRRQLGHDEAKALVAEFEAKGHKQLYWAEQDAGP